MIEGSVHPPRETAAPPTTDRYASIVELTKGVPSRTHEVRNTTLVVGNSLACDVQLQDDTEPRVMCVVAQHGDVFRIEEISDTGRTRLNGVPVKAAPLFNDDHLEIGVSEFAVRTNLPGHTAQAPFIGRYRVSELLGSGGMAWLYAAEDTTTGEIVAIKMLPSRHSEAMRDHFRSEARAGLRIDHPNVVRTLRVPEDESGDTIHLEYLDGINLRELVDLQGPLPWPRACSVAHQTALGLAHIHAAAVVHRDVKPSNIVLLRDGTAKLLDFGLALIKDELVLGPDDDSSGSPTPKRKPVGTPDYISPEQIRNSDAVDGRADLYGLGCTLYFALSGEVPFPGETARDILRAHRKEAPRPLRARNLHPEIPKILERLLAKKRSRRFQTAEEAAAALGRLAQQMPVEFDPVALAEKRGEIAQRRARNLKTTVDNPMERLTSSVTLRLEQSLRVPLED